MTEFSFWTTKLMLVLFLLPNLALELLIIFLVALKLEYYAKEIFFMKLNVAFEVTIELNWGIDVGQRTT